MNDSILGEAGRLKKKHPKTVCNCSGFGIILSQMDYTCIGRLSISIHTGQDKISTGNLNEAIKVGEDWGENLCKFI